MEITELISKIIFSTNRLTKVTFHFKLQRQALFLLCAITVMRILYDHNELLKINNTTTLYIDY